MHDSIGICCRHLAKIDRRGQWPGRFRSLSSYVASTPTYHFTLDGEDSQTRRFGYSVGSGYQFGKMLRADMTMSYVSSDWYVEGGTNEVTGRHKIWSTLLNGYVDLGTYGGFTPYVGAGAGLLRTMDTMRSGMPGLVPQLSSAQTEFAYSLNAGVGYRMSDKLTLDLGYQFLASPKTEYIDFDTLTVEEGVQSHQIKVGVRYNLQ